MSQDLTDEDIQKLMDLGIIPEKNELLAQQMKYANSLRGAPLAQGHSTGGVYTAATPLGMLGSMGQRQMGNQMASQIGQAQQGNLQQQAIGRKQYFDILRRQLGQQQNQPAAPQAGQMIGGPEQF